ncbi:MAG: hypothetical protein J7498_14555 [Sphingobium sp.]|nr:hypothetical protein [Sphingobium sp.]
MTFESKGVDNTGKLDNTLILLDRHNLGDFDWVIMVDDDVELPDQFTDTLLALAEYADLKICGPAHRAHSYWSYPITKRHKNALVRETNFAEVGPIVAFRREIFHLVFPFPSLKYGWGIDSVWPTLIGREGWKTGIADGAALRHVNPIGNTYNLQEATEECEEYMSRFGIDADEHVLRTIATIRDIA